MDFVKWVKDVVYDCARSVSDMYVFSAMSDVDRSELAEDIANQVELEINAQRQENKVPPIPQEILRKIDDRICSMPTPELDYLLNKVNPVNWRMKAVEAGWDIQPEPVHFHIIQPKPVKAWFNPPYTTVQFSDGSKVTVEQDDFEDSKFSEYAGFCCAVTKKLFGSSTAAFNVFEAAKKKAVEDSPKFKKAKARRFEKERKAMIREETRRRREFQIHMEMERLKTEQEAKKRLEADK